MLGARLRFGAGTRGLIRRGSVVPERTIAPVSVAAPTQAIHTVYPYEYSKGEVG